MTQTGSDKREPTNGPAATATLASEALIREIAELTEIKEQPDPMASDNFDADLIVIGSGPGGYVAAIRAAQLGASVICVEAKYLGGTCLNVGCIPSKAMIAAAERYQHIQHSADWGITAKDVSLDFGKMMERTAKVVKTLSGGVGMLFKKNKVRHVEGWAKFVDKNTIEVEKDGKKERLRAKDFILAMGSDVIYLKIPGLEGGRNDGVWTSDDATTAPFLPKSMVIVGGGAVGCEFSYVFNALGCKTTLVELEPNLIPLMDEDLGKELGRVLKKQGVDVRTGSSVEKAAKTNEGWKVTVKTGDKAEEIEAQVVLLGVGRKAMTDHMGLEKLGVKLHKRGVEVKDDTLVTHVDNIYAVGDVTGRIQLAHTAMAEGKVVASNIVQGTKHKVDYKTNPNAVYTSPEVASVGLTEKQAKEQGLAIKVGKYAFRGLGKAIAVGEQEGFVKVIVDEKYGEVLGVHMIGAHVTDMIHEAVVAIKLEATLEYMVETIHAHPTLAEAVLEAFEVAEGNAIHA